MRRLIPFVLTASILVAGVPMGASVRVRTMLQAAQRNSPLTDGPQTARRIEITAQGRTREYLLFVPDNPDGALVLAFHGGGQMATQLEQISGLNSLAQREHFIVAYPQAVERSWNDGRGVTTAEKQGVDDVGFAKAVIADVARAQPVDRSRVFATGLSNGGAFSNRLACEAADLVAAIGPVVATLATSIAATCRPSRPVATISIYGLADPSVAFDGGLVGGNPQGGQVLGARATQELWRSLNGCAAPAVSIPLPILVRDGTSVIRRLFSSCREGADVAAYEIEGGGHRWPPHLFAGRAEELARAENGRSSQNLVASEIIWTFFSNHPRR